MTTNSLSPSANVRPIERFDILGVKMSALNMDTACRNLIDVIEGPRRGYVSVCPVSTIMACQDNEQLRKIVNSANLVTPDGMPSVWVGKARGHKDMDRVYGPDLMLALCGISEQKGYRHFFYGATDQVLEALTSRLKEKFPGLNICGHYSPPFRDLTPDEDKSIVERINAARPDILWVGLGSPKQDLWIDAHRDRLDVGTSMAIGAAFDFLSGMKPQAPRWMQRSGLEWFFRLCCEPKRLWRRYLIGNSRFIYLLSKQILFKRT